MHNIYINYRYSFLFVILILWVGCEPFEPLRENEHHFFSVNGYLDASADTQWVRIMPVRESLEPDPDLGVPEVTLQHLGSGESVDMNDSLFTYFGDRFALVFWTTMEIIPEESYSLTVKGENGKTSYAETTVPDDFPLPQFLPPEFNADILVIQQVEHLADVKVNYRLQFQNTGEIFDWVFPQLKNSVFHPPNTYRTPIDAGSMRIKILESYCGFRVIERNIFVASGGADWPDFVTLDKYSVTLPDGDYSNIEGGVGFFGGVVSKTFPYIDISGDNGLFQAPCP